MIKLKQYILTLLLVFGATMSYAQVTTSSISGTVKDQNGEVMVGATVQAVHQPTGTRYGTTTNRSGNFTLPAVRPGGPYTVLATFAGLYSIRA